MKQAEVFELLDNALSADDRKILKTYIFERAKQDNWDQSNKGGTLDR